MPEILGILLDVSGSMRTSYEETDSQERAPWAMSIFQVIKDLIEFDLPTGIQVFALAYGGKGRNIFDILGTLKKFQNVGLHSNIELPATTEHTEELLSFLESNGANTIRKWVNADDVKGAILDNILILCLSELHGNDKFKDAFINEILPEQCRDWVAPEYGPKTINNLCSCLTFCCQNAVAAAAATFRRATKEEIEKVAEKVLPYLLKQPSAINPLLRVHEAINIVKGYTENTELTLERSKELYGAIKPFLYGATPLYEALQLSSVLLQRDDQRMGKVLFVLSDGYPTDEKYIKRRLHTNDKEEIMRQIKHDLERKNVKVVCCFISRSRETQPKTLYSRKNPDWGKGATFLFDLSSTIQTKSLPCAIFRKRGWSIDITTNETKLFMEVNHPENVKEACDLAQNVICSEDVLSELLVNISLDRYINQTTEAVIAPEQEGGTCYANASATVLHLSMKRILGREGGYPEFEAIREELIQIHGIEGANTLQVLKEICPKYRLHCKMINFHGARKAITEKRPVVARFKLTDREWKTFKKFYNENPTGILTRKDIVLAKRDLQEKVPGHAVVLTSYNSQCLRLMNSWGEQWGDMGFFKVQSADVLALEFIDVFWTSDDLSVQEKTYYKTHGATVAKTILEKIRGLQKQKYTCPLCDQESFVEKFRGTLSRAKCPSCGDDFTCNEDGNILPLNLYLTSLAR